MTKKIKAVKGLSPASDTSKKMSLEDLNKLNKERWTKRTAEFDSLVDSDTERAIERLDHETQQWLALQGQKAIHRQEIQALRPAVDHGKKFQGRKKGAVGPVREKIRTMLTKDPSLEAAAIWEKLQKKLPKGWAVRDTPKLGRYIEIDQKTGAPKSVAYRTFENYCSQEKRLLKA